MYFYGKNLYYYYSWKITMRSHIKTVRSRVFFLLVMFALLITLLALVFSYYVIYSFQQRIEVRSAEFNLQLVASLIGQDLRDLTSLARWSGYNDQISRYLLSGDESGSQNLDAWYRLSEEYINNRSGPYVRRLIVMNNSGTKFLQVGSLTNSIPITVDNVGRIFQTGLERNSQWQVLTADPFIFSGDPLIIPFMIPVYSFLDGGEIGTVFLAANTTLITDKLRDYRLPENSRLYLGMGEEYCLIEGGRIQTAAFPYTVTKRVNGNKRPSLDRQLPSGEIIDAAALVMDGRDQEGRRVTLVRYPLRDELSLVQVLSPGHYISFSGAWPTLAAGFIALIILLIFMAYGVNRMARQISALMNQLLEGEKNKRILEYRMLQSQINPHFLYNTLNSIKWMAAIQNAGGIVEMTTALSRLLRTLSSDIRELVPLRDELLLLEDYLLIQKYRYGDSVNFENRIKDEYLDTPIPRFTLQPLAENAIFHGIEPKGSGSMILSAERKEKDVLLTLSDDGVGMSTTSLPRLDTEALGAASAASPFFRGLGMHNVDERLRYAFGEGYGLSIESEQGSYTAVTIRLPGAAESGP